LDDEMANHPNRSNKRIKEIDGYRIELSRYVPEDVWWAEIVRLADGVKFGVYELFGRSFTDPAEAMQKAERWVANTIRDQAEFARLQSPRGNSDPH